MTESAETTSKLELPSLALAAICELAVLPQWVCWRYEQRARKWTKVPLQPNGRLASSTDPKTWSTFAACAQALTGGLGDGVGFVFSPNDPFVGIDLDKCIDLEGVLAPWAEKIVREIDSYTERSPSGRGLHVIARGRLPAGGRKKKVVIDGHTVGEIEMYDRGRYFTMTGKPWTA